MLEFFDKIQTCIDCFESKSIGLIITAYDLMWVLMQGSFGRQLCTRTTDALEHSSLAAHRYVAGSAMPAAAHQVFYHIQRGVPRHLDGHRRHMQPMSGKVSWGSLQSLTSSWNTTPSNTCPCFHLVPSSPLDDEFVSQISQRLGPAAALRKRAWKGEEASKMSHWALKRRQSSEALQRSLPRCFFGQNSRSKRLLSGCGRAAAVWRATREPCRGQGNGDDDGH